MEGHAFIAKVEHTQAGNMVSRVVGNSDECDLDLTAYRTAEPICDHCRSIRNRRDTFVLRAPDGALKQIGRNCLADYLRSSSVDTVVAIMDLVNEFERTSHDDPEGDGEGFGGGGYYARDTTAAFLACAVSAVRTVGWVGSKAAEFGQTTAQYAGWLSGRCPSNEKAAEEWHRNQPTDLDRERAATVLAWLKGTTDASDYMHNLRVACASELLAKAGRGPRRSR